LTLPFSPPSIYRTSDCVLCHSDLIPITVQSIKTSKIVLDRSVSEHNLNGATIPFGQVTHRLG
jgi:hypothetical protein